MRLVRSRRFAAIALAMLAAAACANLDGLTGGSSTTAPPDGASPTDVITTLDAIADAPVDAPKDDAKSADEVRIILGEVGGVGHADGPGPNARFDGPSALAKDLAGNLYVIDGGGTVIRKIAAGTQEVTTIAGAYRGSGKADGTGIEARFEGASGLAFDGKSTLFVSQYGDCRIRSIDLTTNVVKTVFGLGCSESTLLAPAALQWNSSDSKLYVLDSGRLRALQIDGSSATAIETACGKTGQITKLGDCAEASFPGSAFVLGNATKFLVRAGDGVVAVELSNHTVTAYGLAPGGRGLAIGQSSLLLATVTSSTVSNLVNLPFGGTSVPFAGLGKSLPVDGALSEAGFEDIGALLGDSPSSYVVADLAAVRQIKPTGVSTLAGRARTHAFADGVGENVRIGPVSSITKDEAGHLFFYDRTHAVVRSFDRTTGEVKTITGILDTYGVDGGISDPDDDALVFDGTQLLLLEPGAYAIRVIDPVAGTKRFVEYFDGVGHAAASDGKGRIFATTAIDDAVQEVKLDGSATTLATIKAIGGGYGHVRGMCFDATAKALFVTDIADRAVKRIDLLADGGAGPVTAISDGFVGPDGIACDGKGHVYVTEYYRSTITLVDIATGAKKVVAGVDNHVAVVPGPLPASLNNPASPIFLDEEHLLVGSRNEAVLLSVPLPAQ